MDNARTTLKLAEAPEESASQTQIALDARVLSSLLIKLKVEDKNNSPQDAHARLAELTRSQSIGCLLKAAGDYSEQEKIPPETALRQIVADIFELDTLWNQVLLQEGVARLTSQYH